MRRLAIALAGSVVLLPASCGRQGPPPRIAYPYPWIGAALLRVAQPAIDAWGRPRAVEIPESLMARVAHRVGYSGDIDYAEAMAALPGLVASVGPQSSRATLLVAPIYAEQGIPLIAATATSHRLHAVGPWMFQLAPDDSAEGAFMARFILDRLEARRVTIFYLLADEYGLDLRDGLVRALQLRGISPVDEVGMMVESDLPRRVATSLRHVVPDVVVIAARGPEAIAITRSVHERLPAARVVVGDGVPLNTGFVSEVGAAASSVYGVTWWHADLPDPLSRAFAARFAEANGHPPTAAEAVYYDAIMVAAQAVRDGGRSRAGVRRYLSALGTTRPPYRGVTGPISFAPDRPANLLMTRVVDGAVVIAEGPRRDP